MRSQNLYKYTILFTVWIISAVYVGGFVNRGWIPHDEGSLAQSAERVLGGELPHRDFDEIYTGGLSFLYAAAFKLLGTNLLSIRYALFVFFLIFVPAFYAIGLRFASPWIAGAITLVGVVWSVPNYFAGVPSWYNLFFAVLGTFALIRHVETGRASWLFVAGLWGGLSFLAKVTGIYYIVAVCLFLIFREKFLSSAAEDRPPLRTYTYLVGVAYGCVLVSIIFLLRSRLGLMEAFHFLLPTAAICGFLFWEEWRDGRGGLSSRCGTLFSLLLPFGCGVMAPIAVFLVPYFLTNSLGHFVEGVLILPQKRFAHASMDFPSILTVVASVPYAMLLLWPFGPNKNSRLGITFQLALILPLGLAVSFAEHFAVYGFLWLAIRCLGVAAVLAGCVTLFRSFAPAVVPDTKHQILVLLVIMTALLSLIQFPYAAPIYFVYTIPLIVLTLLAVVMVQPQTPRLLHLGVLGCYFVFAILWTNTGYVWHLGGRYRPYQPSNVLDGDRARIRVGDADKVVYSRIVELIHKHGGSADYIFASPDCPEIYFLAAMRNPTRVIFDFLNRSGNKPTELLEVLREKDVKVVALNNRPHFSGVLNPGLMVLLSNRFPFSVDVGQFTVRWKE